MSGGSERGGPPEGGPAATAACADETEGSVEVM